MAVFGPPFVAVPAAVAVFVVNIAGQGVKIVVDTDLQHECADEYRGRVFSLSDTRSTSASWRACSLAALVLPPDGRSVEVLVAVALGFVAVALWYARGRRPVGEAGRRRHPRLCWHPTARA